jgi:hypothetical protein
MAEQPPEPNKSLFDQSSDDLAAREAAAGTPFGEPFTAKDRVFQREHNQAAARKGGVPPPDPNLADGIEQGVKSPGFDSIRGAQDVNGAMSTYQNQLTQTLTTMARILVETTIRLEQLEQYFDRLR